MTIRKMTPAEIAERDRKLAEEMRWSREADRAARRKVYRLLLIAVVFMIAGFLFSRYVLGR